MSTVVDVQGVPIWCGRRREARDELEALIDSGTPAYICCAPVHLVESARRDERVARALREAAMVFPDGAAVAWVARFMSHDVVDRVCGSDVFNALTTETDIAYRHFFYGSTVDVLTRIETRLRMRAPAAILAGSHAPPFRPLTALELKDDARLINAAAPDSVWVGVGAPKQELWMSEMRALLNAPLSIGVGAVLGVVAGTRARAPRVVQAAGFEWLYRLCREPRRLASRYLRTNTSFIVGVASAVSRSRRGA
jgi:N-acetylglucosaminyldiphosphoundecaprenol N-acetyl-beta-D-mannosaminyltransferase